MADGEVMVAGDGEILLLHQERVASQDPRVQVVQEIAGEAMVGLM